MKQKQLFAQISEKNLYCLFSNIILIGQKLVNCISFQKTTRWADYLESRKLLENCALNKFQAY